MDLYAVWKIPAMDNSWRHITSFLNENFDSIRWAQGREFFHIEANIRTSGKPQEFTPQSDIFIPQ